MDTQGKAVKSVNSKLAISKSTNSSTKSVDVTTRSMSKKLNESSQMSPLAKYVEKNLHSPSDAGDSDANKSPPSSPRSMSSYSFTTNVAAVMVTNATTIEEQLSSLTRAIEGLMKHVQEQDAQIARLINKADNVDASHVMGKNVEAHDEVKAPTKQHYTEKDKYAKELQISSDGLIPVDQLKSKNFSIVSTALGELTAWLSLQILGNGKKNRPLIISIGMHWGLRYVLQGILPKSFEELATRAHEMELSMTASGVEGPPIQEFRRTKEKQEVKKRGNPFSKAQSKELMVVKIASFKLKSTAKDNVAPRNNVPYEMPQRKLTLKEMQVREYPFLDSDVPGIFDDLLEANLLDLTEMERSEKAEQKDDPKYCKYHRCTQYKTTSCSRTRRDSSDADDCMCTITFTDEDLLLGSKPHNRPLFIARYPPHDPRLLSRRTKDTRRQQIFTKAESHFADVKYYIEDAKKGNEVLPSEEPKSCNNQNTRKNASSTLKVELSKDLILPLTQINLKQPLKPPLKGFVPSTQEEEGYEVLFIDKKGFDPKAVKLLIKARYNPKENLSPGKLTLEPPARNSTDSMLPK
ncbi:hypothetical protein Sango_2057700 [Sesamum angolense]|uniref:Uncharacterized protein n=1 Tax=Sesamum angolense TaxID=2727404 RepID=A0AAE1WG13_9LAMI|nr:hypothetical protein Sango_2057700 [Sesamum angolense]